MPEPVDEFTFTPNTVACPTHMEPFRAQWPMGFAHFAMTGFDWFLRLPETVEASRGDAKAAHAMLKVSPICCRLGEQRLYELYLEAERMFPLWTIARCDWCKDATRFTTAYTAVNHWGRPLLGRKACLMCVTKKALPGTYWKPGSN